MTRQAQDATGAHSRGQPTQPSSPEGCLEESPEMQEDD